MSRPGFARLSSIETLDPDRLSDRHSRQSDTSSGAEQLRRTRSRWRRVRLLTVLLSRDSRLSHVVVGERYRSTARRLRLIHAAKTGAATLLAASVSLIDPFERATNGTGVWCVITTLIVMQSQTLGGTTHKTVNRVIGTVAAAIAALAAGFVANVLETAHRSLAAVFVGGCVFAATGAATFLAGSKSWALWSYAFFLTALTFDFLLLLECRRLRTAAAARRGVPHSRRREQVPRRLHVWRVPHRDDPRRRRHRRLRLRSAAKDPRVERAARQPSLDTRRRQTLASNELRWPLPGASGGDLYET